MTVSYAGSGTTESLPETGVTVDGKWACDACRLLGRSTTGSCCGESETALCGDIWSCVGDHSAASPSGEEECEA